MFHPFDPSFFLLPFISTCFFLLLLFPFVGVQFSTVHPVHNLKRSKLNRVGDYCSFYCPEIPVEKKNQKEYKKWLHQG
jgi:hypothetical protein